MVTISDNRVPVDDGTYEALLACPTYLPDYPCIPCHYVYVKTNPATDGVVDRYTAVVITANDYYPFGMLMPGRKYSADGTYRYGFNGKENDNEVKGEGGQQDYGMRIYDPRLGRFLSVDPITKEYPELTPYQFASNSPVEAIDLDGLERYAAKAGVAAENLGITKIKPPNNAIIVYKQLSTKATCHGPANSEFRVPGYRYPYTWEQWKERSGFIKAVEIVDEGSDYIPSPKAPVKKIIKKTWNVIEDVFKKPKPKKSPPNPYGKKGGPEHQKTVDEVEKDLIKQGFDKIEKEVPVSTKGGVKDKRYIDVQGTNTKTGDVKQVQVGKENKNGTPVSRERKALDDVEKATGNRPDFVPYNKPKL